MSVPRRWYSLAGLNAYWFGVSFMWNALHTLVLPLLLLPYTSEGTKNSAYGLLTFVGLAVAMMVQPLSGTFSDHTRHRWGRRRPWLILGTMLDLACLLILALSQGFWGVAIGYILLQCASNLAHGAGQGLIPDLVPRRQHGVAAGIKSLFDISAIIAAALAMGRLASIVPWGTRIALAIIAGVLTIVLALTLLATRREAAGEAPTPEGEPVDRWAQAKALLSVDLRAHRDYARLLLARFFVLLGTIALQAFAFYYLRDALHIASPAQAVGQLMAVIGVSVLVVVYPAGWLSERLGRKTLMLFACGLAAVGLAALLAVHNLQGLLAIGCLVGVSLGIFNTVNWAWATDLVPVAEAGKYLGLSNLATAGSAAVGRLFGPVIDLTNAVHPNLGYTLLFSLASLGALAALFIARRVPETSTPTWGRRASGGLAPFGRWKLGKHPVEERDL